MDKKAKQSKMLDILSSLQSHKDDLTKKDFDKLLSSKTLGQPLPHAPHARKPSLEVAVEEEVPEDVDYVKRPVISSEVRERVELNFSGME